MNESLRVMILEDRAADAALMAEELHRAGYHVEWERVDSREDYVAALDRPFDVILADYRLPQFNAMEALSLLRERDGAIPFIVVTGSVSEEVAVQCMKEGAADYLLKDRLARLGPAVEQALRAQRLDQERHRAEVALRESEERYRTLFNSSPEAILLINLEGVIVDCNPATLEISGYAREELIGKPVLSLDHLGREELPLYRKLFRRAIEGQELAPIELEALGPQGKKRWFEVFVSRVEKDGTPTAIQVISHDISERRRLEEQIRRQERLAAIGELAGGIAHDFNNFLTTIMLYAQMGLDKPNLMPDVRQALETIVGESRQAVQLVRQILDFSRRSPMEPRPVDLTDQISASIEVLARTLPEDIDFELVIEPQELIAEVDPTRIEQVLMNLINNARDAMPGGGHLQVRVSSLTLGSGETPPVAEMPPGRWACLSVRDTGIGMTKHVQAHLFEPFFTTKKPGKGTGLGLAQVHGIVTQHGGYIDVESEVGQGTTLRIYLPLSKLTIIEHDDKRIEVPQGAGETIILVEDNERLRRISEELLNSLGYHAVTASNGREALELCHSMGHPDLILTDLVMPEMGGRELIHQIQALDPAIRILAVTGYALAEEEYALDQLDVVVEVIQKPFEVDTLAWAVKRALTRGREYHPR